MKAIQKNYIQALSKKIFGRQIFLRFLFFYIFLFSFPFPSLFSLSIFNSYFPVSLLILLKLKMSIWAKCQFEQFLSQLGGRSFLVIVCFLSNYWLKVFVRILGR